MGITVKQEDKNEPVTKRTHRPRYQPTEAPPFVLTERDIAIMLALGRHKIMSSQQIGRLFPTSHFNIRYRLKCLFHARYIARPAAGKRVPSASHSGRGGILYVLLPRGAKEIAARRGI